MLWQQDRLTNFRIVFDSVGLNWEKYICVDDSLFWPIDINEGYANPKKANEQLGWRAKLSMKEVASLMVNERIH